jgi:hypothetical protein
MSHSENHNRAFWDIDGRHVPLGCSEGDCYLCQTGKWRRMNSRRRRAKDKEFVRKLVDEEEDVEEYKGFITGNSYGVNILY